MAKNRNSDENDESNSAPEPDRWYNLTLGSSFMDHRPSPKFCTLRYKFKPASIDKNQPGLFHKSKDNRVTVEFHNNQHGKPKVTFEGVSEDYKENDAVLFFDGETFRLERLHRAVKRLRHVRLPGESAAQAATVAGTSISAQKSHSLPTGGKGANLQPLDKDVLPHMPVEVKGIDINISESLAPGATSETNKDFDCPLSLPNPPTASPDADAEPISDEMDEEFEVIIDDDVVHDATEKGRSPGKEFHSGIDMNLPHPGDMDDEIADVDVSDDVVDNGPNAAEALRAQVNAEVGANRASSSSYSSGSESSGSKSGSGSGSESDSGSSSSESNSGSSSSDSESSEGGDSVNSI